MALSLLLLLVLLTVPGGTEGSYCMATDCRTTGLSLYQRVCCVNSNLGRSHTINGNGITQYILCPKVTPKSCPPPGKFICGLGIIIY